MLPWKVIGQYRTSQLPEVPLDSTLPHPLGALPAYFNRHPPPAKEKKEPVQTTRWRIP
jgi:hypothetical protein